MLCMVMGSTVSCRTGRPRQKKSFRSSAPPESCLDLNAATEEELMTLPGVNRALAQNITAHRRKIHGFRRVEDLALVTGVGAELMLELRPEILVGNSPPSVAQGNGQELGIEFVGPSGEPLPGSLDEEMLGTWDVNISSEDCKSRKG